MIESDKTEFELIMRGLAENFNADISKTGLRFRFEALMSFDISQVRTAAYGLVATRKYTTMPTIAEFLEHINGGSVDDKAQVEAGKVWKALSGVGGYQNVCFDDPTTQAVIVQSFGGWQKLCAETMVDQQKWFIKEFCSAYGAYSRQGIKHFGALTGVFGEKTFLIGDESKAQQVLITQNSAPINQITDTKVEGIVDILTKQLE